jgi:hypothetical protein
MQMETMPAATVKGLVFEEAGGEGEYDEGTVDSDDDEAGEANKKGAGSGVTPEAADGNP